MPQLIRLATRRMRVGIHQFRWWWLIQYRSQTSRVLAGGLQGSEGSKHWLVSVSAINLRSPHHMSRLGKSQDVFEGNGLAWSC